MGDSWIVSNLNAALTTWNDKLGEIWQLLTVSPASYNGGAVWATMTGIHGALQAIAYGLLVLFFAVGVVKTCGSFVEAKKPEHALKLFIRFVLAKAAVDFGMDLMLAIFSIVQGMISQVIGSSEANGIGSSTLPQDLIDAFLSIEDSRFFQHNGFDLPRFISSALNNLSSGTLSQGGSTLTMQLVDNTWIRPMEEEEINSGETISRFESIRHKIQEIYLSLLTEQSIDKKAIIVNYLNLIWFGSDGGTRGVQNAAQYYFGKDVNDLNLSECAFLAGVINAPLTYNPYNLNGDSTNHYEAATNRRNETLRMMYQHGYISEEERDLAMSTNLSYQLQRGESYSGDPYQSYVEQVVNEVRELTGQDPYTVPMDIYTGMDSDAQQLAYNISNGEVYSFPNQYFNIGLTVIDNESGEIVLSRVVIPEYVIVHDGPPSDRGAKDYFFASEASPALCFSVAADLPALS